jgi:DNA-binding transcriptional LysR family regulator
MDALTLQQFVVFVTTAEEGSFAAAARKLNRAQSAIIYAVQKLEEQTGVTLFDRSGYRSVLTDAGTALFPRAKRIIDELEQYRAQSRDLARGLESRVALVVDPHAPSDFLTRRLIEFRRMFPRVDVQTTNESFRSAVHSLLQGAAQIAFVVELDRLPDDFERTVCGTIELVPVAGTEHPLAAREGKLDLQALRVHTELTDASESGVEDLTAAGRRWTIGDVDLRRDLMLAQVGWGWMPRSKIVDDLAAGRLVELDVDDKTPQARTGAFPIVVAHLKKEPLGPATRWLFAQFSTRHNGVEVAKPRSEIAIELAGNGERSLPR